MNKFLNKTAEATAWIYNPWLDLIVGCGAWSTPLLLISYFAVASSARTWSVVFYILAFFFNYPHYMATIYRAYHRAEDFHKYRVFTVHITALMLLTLVLSHSWLRILPWIFTIYLTWSPWHYSGQNYGLFMMFARRAGADPDKATRRALYGAFIVSYLILFLGFHTGPSADPLFLSLGIPALVSRWEQIILGIAFVALSVFGLSRLARATGWRKLTPSLTLFSTQCLWFLVPTAIALIRGLEIPQNRYSTGVLAVMHSAQYLWITSYYARREASSGAAEAAPRSWRPLAYFGVLIIGGIALFVPGPWLASRAFHHDFTASFLIFTALVNIHHFILDGAIWKLRDGRIASLLLNSREGIADAASQAGGRIAAACRWLAGSTSAARALRVSAAALLLIWGTIDQMRYYLGLHSDDLRSLQRAAALDSTDSALETRLGRKALDVGDAQQAEAAWRRAIAVNPADPAPRQELLRLLIDEKRLDEALKLTDASLQYASRDANLLFDRGLLAQQLGQPDAARFAWQQALTVDPSHSLARLYLANELDREGKAREAATDYEMFLQGLAHQSRQARPEPEKVIAIALRMADCQARSSQTDRAVKSYHLAEKLAVQTKLPKLESVADVNEAALQAQTGKLDDALQLYQHALRLDKADGDPSAAAQDWFAYGSFLNDAGFSARLAYACLLKSESVAQSLPDPAVQDSHSAARGQLQRTLEKQLGTESAKVRRDLNSAIEQALALRR